MKIEIYPAAQALILVQSAVVKIQLECMDAIEMIVESQPTDVVKPTGWRRWLAKAAVRRTLHSDEVWENIIGVKSTFDPKLLEAIKKTIDTRVSLTAEIVGVLTRLRGELLGTPPESMVEIKHNLDRSLDEYR
jgi:hypothetical protein